MTANDIDSFVDAQANRGLKPSTINRRVVSLHTFFEYLASERPDETWPNPVNRRRHCIKENELLPRDAKEEEVSALFATIADVRDQAMFGLMVGAGLRVGEVVSLRHTFARRLAEQGMPIESIGQLLGHSNITTTQRYTAGADLELRDAFLASMAQFESMPPLHAQMERPILASQRQQVQADRRALEQALDRLAALPPWLEDLLSAYFRYRWPQCRPPQPATKACPFTQSANFWAIVHSTRLNNMHVSLNRPLRNSFSPPWLILRVSPLSTGPLLSFSTEHFQNKLSAQCKRSIRVLLYLACIVL